MVSKSVLAGEQRRSLLLELHLRLDILEWEGDGDLKRARHPPGGGRAREAVGQLGFSLSKKEKIPPELESTARSTSHALRDQGSHALLPLTPAPPRTTCHAHRDKRGVGAAAAKSCPGAFSRCREAPAPESQVGITETCTPGPGFRAATKQRYSDFIVNEVRLSGEPVHLASLPAAVAQKAAEEEELDTHERDAARARVEARARKRQKGGGRGGGSVHEAAALGSRSLT